MRIGRSEGCRDGCTSPWCHRDGTAGGQQSAGITQNNTFNVTGADAKTIASSVEGKIRSANADLVRWHTGAVLG